MRKKIITPILDIYFKRPFLMDMMLIGVAIFLLCYNQHRLCIKIDSSRIDEILSNLISSIVALSGFILASLTIIVTVKSNIKIRNLEDAKNGLELILASNNYKTIISIFRDAIIELTFALAVLYIFWFPVFGLTVFQYLLLIAFGILIIILTISRTLLMLFRLIFLEFKKAG